MGRNSHARMTSHGHRFHFIGGYTYILCIILNALDSAYGFSFYLAVPVADLQALHTLGKLSTVPVYPQSLCIKAIFKKLLGIEQ